MYDNYEAFLEHEAEQLEWEKELPVCSYCDEPIQQSTAVRIGDLWYCDHCLNKYFRESIGGSSNV